MTNNEIQVLKWLYAYMQSFSIQRIALPAIDRIVMKNDENIILNGQLLDVLNDLKAAGLIENTLGKGYAITSKGVEFIKTSI